MLAHNFLISAFPSRNSGRQSLSGHYEFMKIKAVCCIFWLLFTNPLLASEVPNQEDPAIPMLVATQAELIALKSLIKEVLGLQEQNLVLQSTALDEAANIAAQERLHGDLFNRAIDILLLEQSKVRRDTLLANGVLGALLIFLILKLRLPPSKRLPSNSAATTNDLPNEITNNSEGESTSASATAPLETLMSGGSPKSITPTMQVDVPPSASMGPSISSITIGKATPFFDGDISNQASMSQLGAGALNGNLSAILLEAGRIKQENLGRIGNPQQQTHIPPINLVMRFPNVLGAKRSIKEKIIKSKIYSLREASKRKATSSE